MTEKLEVVVSNYAHIKGTLPAPVVEYLDKRLTFANPEFEDAAKHGRWTKHLAPTLTFLTKTGDGYRVPRGFSAQLLHILRYHRVPYDLVDDTRVVPEVPFKFHASLYPFQQKAVSAILARRFGVLNSPTGSGKTVMALSVVAQRRQPTLIICHTRELLYQWRDRAAEFLGLASEDVGLIGDGQRQIGRQLTIAIVNTLYKCTGEIRDKIGFFIVDECHRVAARTFTEAVTELDSRYMLGLSATAYRRDRLTRLIYLYIGDRVYEISPQELQKIDKIMTARLVVRPTNFWSYTSGSSEYQALITELTEDEKRNDIIVADVVAEAKKDNGTCLVLSDRKSHCRKLYEMIAHQGFPVELLTGDTPKKERQSIVRDLELGLVKILVATGSLVGEGFDCKRLHSLFMTTPVKFTGRVTQYLGRILRTAEGKTQPKVYDYLDRPGVLQHSFRSRKRAYESMGVAE